MRVSEDWTDASDRINCDKDNGKPLFDKDRMEGTAEVYFATTGTNLAVTRVSSCSVWFARRATVKLLLRPGPQVPEKVGPQSLSIRQMLSPPSTDRSRFFDGVCCNGFGDRLRHHGRFATWIRSGVSCVIGMPFDMFGTLETRFSGAPHRSLGSDSYLLWKRHRGVMRGF
jgi:hypothetical protein